MTWDSEDHVLNDDLFAVPDGFYEPDQPATFATYMLRSGQPLTLRLVGHNPLWVRRHPATLST